MAEQLRKFRTQTLTLLSLMVVSIIVGGVKLGIFSWKDRESNAVIPTANADVPTSDCCGFGYPSNCTCSGEQTDCTASDPACFDCGCIGDGSGTA
jgi:hypothetical protein